MQGQVDGKGTDPCSDSNRVVLFKRDLNSPASCWSAPAQNTSSQHVGIENKCCMQHVRQYCKRLPTNCWRQTNRVWFLVVMGTPRRSALAFICIVLPIVWLSSREREEKNSKKSGNRGKQTRKSRTTHRCFSNWLSTRNKSPRQQVHKTLIHVLWQIMITRLSYLMKCT